MLCAPRLHLGSIERELLWAADWLASVGRPGLSQRSGKSLAWDIPDQSVWSSTRLLGHRGSRPDGNERIEQRDHAGIPTVDSHLAQCSPYLGSRARARTRNDRQGDGIGDDFLLRAPLRSRAETGSGQPDEMSAVERAASARLLHMSRIIERGGKRLTLVEH